MKAELFLSWLYLLLSVQSGSVRAQSNGELRLARDSESRLDFDSGRLEIFINGQWGTICDDSFDLDEANVACRQLGWTGALDVHTSFLTSYGSGSGTIWLDEVDCSDRNSRHLLSCNNAGIGMENCIHAEDVAVTCTSTRIYDNPNDLDIRLQDGTFISQGRVEVYCNGEWGTICEVGGFGQDEADTICRQLGYTNAASFSRFSLPGSSFQPIWLRLLQCGASSANLAQCSMIGTCSSFSFDYYDNRDCLHIDDATIECDFDSDLLIVPSTPRPNDGGSDTPIGTISAASGGAILVAIIVCIILCCCCLQRRRNNTTTTIHHVPQPNTTVINVQQQQQMNLQPAAPIPPAHVVPIQDRYMNQAPPSHNPSVTGYDHQQGKQQHYYYRSQPVDGYPIQDPSQMPYPALQDPSQAAHGPPPPYPTDTHIQDSNQMPYPALPDPSQAAHGPPHPYSADTPM